LDTSWLDETRTRIAGASEVLRSKYPETEVQVEVRHAWTADVLVDAAATSDLLVVGRHGGRHGLPSRLGSLARTAVRESPSPVLVVPL
jgi:nucleotide-binding universal stress UspA family protein